MKPACVCECEEDAAARWCRLGLVFGQQLRRRHNGRTAVYVSTSPLGRDRYFPSSVSATVTSSPSSHFFSTPLETPTPYFSASHTQSQKPIHIFLSIMDILPISDKLDARALLQARSGSAIGDFFSLPMILGFVVVVFLAIGIAAMTKIYRGDGSDGRTIPL